MAPGRSLSTASAHRSPEPPPPRRPVGSRRSISGNPIRSVGRLAVVQHLEHALQLALPKRTKRDALRVGRLVIVVRTSPRRRRAEAPPEIAGFGPARPPDVPADLASELFGPSRRPICARAPPPVAARAPVRGLRADDRDARIRNAGDAVQAVSDFGLAGREMVGRDALAKLLAPAAAAGRRWLPSTARPRWQRPISTPSAARPVATRPVEFAPPSTPGLEAARPT